MNSLILDIQTPEKLIFSGKVKSLVAKAIDGELGILPGHAPLATILSSGPLRYRLEDGQERVLQGMGGYLMVNRDHISALLMSQ